MVAPASPAARASTRPSLRPAIRGSALLTWLLLASVILAVPGAVQAADWSSDLPDLHVLAAIAFGMATLLVALPLPGWLVGIGVVLTGAPVVLWRLFLTEPFAATPGIEGRLADLGARLDDWADRVVVGARISDPVPFVFLMLCGTWLVVAGGTAFALRTRRPWPLLLALAVTLLAALDRASGGAGWRLPVFAAGALALAAHLRLPVLGLGDGARMRYSAHLSPVTIATTALVVAGLWLGVRAVPTEWLPHQLQLPWVEERTVARPPTAQAPAPAPTPAAPPAPAPLPTPSSAIPTPTPTPTPTPLPSGPIPDAPLPAPRDDAHTPVWALALLYGGAGLILVGAAGTFAWLWTLRRLSVPERNWASLCRVVRLLRVAPPRSCTPLEAAARLGEKLGGGGVELRRLALDYQHARYGRWQPGPHDVTTNAAAWVALKPRLVRSGWRAASGVAAVPRWAPTRPALPTLSVWRPAMPARHLRVAAAAMAALTLIGVTLWIALPRSTDGPAREPSRDVVAVIEPADRPLVAALPARAAPADEPEPPQTWTVQPGDTLSGIAASAGTTVPAIVRLNGLANEDLIVVGQVLLLP